MPFYCKVCTASRAYPGKDALLDHLQSVHYFDEGQYLLTISEASIEPEEEKDFSKPTKVEQDFLKKYVGMGLDKDDPRLHRVCFLQATIRRVEEEVRQADSPDVSRLQDLKTIIKESRDTLGELFREKQKGEGDKSVHTMFSETMTEMEKHTKKNIGDFQLRCRTCQAWISTDGLPVWMLYQVPDPENPRHRIYYIGNPEIFHLVSKGKLSLGSAAFILRTSPEALIYTARAMGISLFPKDKEAFQLALGEHTVDEIRSGFEDAQEKVH